MLKKKILNDLAQTCREVQCNTVFSFLFLFLFLFFRMDNVVDKDKVCIFGPYITRVGENFLISSELYVYITAYIMHILQHYITAYICTAENLTFYSPPQM
jgi:hypothetical protein